MILAAMPRPAKLPPPTAPGPRETAATLAGGSEGVAVFSVREGGGAIAAPVAVEKQSRHISWSRIGRKRTQAFAQTFSQHETRKLLSSSRFIFLDFSPQFFFR